MAEDRKAYKHTVIMDQRQNLAMTGILDVISFDEENVIAETEKGVIIIKGINLHVKKLNLDISELDIEGEIFNITYEDDGFPASKRGSFFSKIFK